jgi:uncharacterized protein
MSAGDVPEVDLDPQTFAVAARNLGLAPGAEVQIAGGEPLLVPDVVESVAEQAHRLGVSRISVQTNGIGIDERFIALVKRYRLGVGVSLDGPPATNDAVRGRSGEVLRGLARLEAASIPFGVTAVISRDTVATLPDLGLLLAGFSQARSLGLDILRPAGRAREEDLATPAALRQAFITLSERLAWVNRQRSTPLRLRELAAADCGGRARRSPPTARCIPAPRSPATPTTTAARRRHRITPACASACRPTPRRAATAPPAAAAAAVPRSPCFHRARASSIA